MRQGDNGPRKRVTGRRPIFLLFSAIMERSMKNYGVMILMYYLWMHLKPSMVMKKINSYCVTLQMWSLILKNFQNSKRL